MNYMWVPNLIILVHWGVEHVKHVWQNIPILQHFIENSLYCNLLKIHIDVAQYVQNFVKYQFLWDFSISITVWPSCLERKMYLGSGEGKPGDVIVIYGCLMFLKVGIKKEEL